MEAEYTGVVGGLCSKPRCHQGKSPADWQVVTEPSAFCSRSNRPRICPKKPSSMSSPTGSSSPMTRMTLGVGPDKPTVWSVHAYSSRPRIAWMAVLASDAFFPFADNIEEIAQAGIKAIIQPGGICPRSRFHRCT